MSKASTLIMTIFSLEIFQSPIRTTQCGHLFCERCLFKVTKGEQRWLCPECRTPHQCAVNTLIRNYRIEKVAEKIKMEKAILRPRNLFGTCLKHDRAIEYRE